MYYMHDPQHSMCTIKPTTCTMQRFASYCCAAPTTTGHPMASITHHISHSTRCGLVCNSSIQRTALSAQCQTHVPELVPTIATQHCNTPANLSQQVVTRCDRAHQFAAFATPLHRCVLSSSRVSASQSKACPSG